MKSQGHERCGEHISSLSKKVRFQVIIEIAGALSTIRRSLKSLTKSRVTHELPCLVVVGSTVSPRAILVTKRLG